MPDFTITGVHSLGVALDPAPYELVPAAFTTGNNVRFNDAESAIIKNKGYESVFTTVPITPYWLLPVPTTTAYYWLVGGLTKVYVTNGTTYTNITRQTASVDVNYNATQDIRWNGGVLNSIPVINNSYDPPQMWSPTDSATKLVALSNWQANTLCAVIRPFGYFLVALDITKTTTRYPTMVKWSHPADPGAVPTSWNEADPTKDAGEISLSQSTGYVIDCLTLRNVNIIYKEDSTYVMQYIGGASVFSFQLLFKDAGILGRDCVAEFNGKHFVVTNNDVIVHDGSNWQSVINNKVRRGLFNTISQTYGATRSCCVRNYKYNEIWFLYPEEGYTTANRALVWNITTGAISFRNILNITFAANGITNITTTTDWASDSASWDSDLTAWGERTYGSVEPRMVLSATTPELRLYESTEQDGGSNITATVERTGLDFGDRAHIKTVREIWPYMTGEAVQIYIGAQLERDDSVTWQGPFAFDPSSQRKVECLVTGRYIGYRIVSTTNVSWKLQGINFVYSQNGFY